MYKFLIISLIIFLNFKLCAGNGDVIRVVSHDSVLIKTDPSKGHTEYPVFVSFPGTNIKYRKILLSLTFRCPPSPRRCGEWDYGNHVFLRRTGGVKGKDRNIELQSFITPYGNGFPQKWGYTWTADVTDYAALLHDSVEIEYQHSGYEENVARSWLVDLKFDITEGDPILDPFKYDTLWVGSKNYGNAAKTLETYLSTPKSIISDSFAQYSRVKIFMTGHGSDTIDQCGEFCSKNIELFNSNISKGIKTLWRDCGYHGLFPQAGTWSLPRANWCPGQFVDPIHFDEILTSKKSNNFKIIIDPKTHEFYKQGNFVINSYYIQYLNKAKDYDVAVSDIISPSTNFQYNRLNPTCSNPEIEIVNNGKNKITSLYVVYGIGQNEFIYKWTGNLNFLEKTKVVLPNLVLRNSTDTTFYVYTSAPNGYCDQYPLDDTMKSFIPKITPIDSFIVFQYKTSLRPNDFSYSVTDDLGTVLYQKPLGSLTSPTTLYKDTFKFSPGCYKLVFKNEFEEFGYGLGVWFWTAVGTGSAKLVNKSGTTLKTYATDFGRFFQEYFYVGNPTYRTISNPSITCKNLNLSLGKVDSKNNQFNIYPNPAFKDVTLEWSIKQKISILKIYDLSGKIISSIKYFDLYTDTIHYNVENLHKGSYIFEVQMSDNSVVSSKLQIEK